MGVCVCVSERDGEQQIWNDFFRFFFFFGNYTADKAPALKAYFPRFSLSCLGLTLRWVPSFINCCPRVGNGHIMSTRVVSMLLF